MTFFETKDFNERYQEQEAVVKATLGIIYR